MRTSALFFLLAVGMTLSAYGQVDPKGSTSINRTPVDTSLIVRDTVAPKRTDRSTPHTHPNPGRIRRRIAQFPNSPLSRIDVRWGWSILSDDGTFLQNPLRFNNWENVTIRPLPASFSVHFPYYAKANGAMGQIGFQTYYSASKAQWIGGAQNFGTAYFFGSNVDFRSIFPTIRIEQARINPFVNYGVGYTYRSVALHHHEPIVHFGGGLTNWLSERVGITFSGTANFGTFHLISGFTSYLQANVYVLYRI